MQFPELPAPYGRMEFSLNPFTVLGALIGTKRMLAFVFATLATSAGAALIWGLPFIQALITLTVRTYIYMCVCYQCTLT